MQTLWKKGTAILALALICTSTVQATPILSKKGNRSTSSKSTEQLIPNFPWETVQDNVFKFKYQIINLDPQNFNPAKVEEIAKTVQEYVEKYVYPNWHMAVEIDVFTPVNNNSLTLFFGTSLDPNVVTGTYIPIYLVNEFNSNIENDFAIAIHGNVSGSVINGPNALTYLPAQPNAMPTYPNPSLETPALYQAIPFGTPFVVIPAGSTSTGNGIQAAVTRNRADTSLGPKILMRLSLTLSREVIETLINPTGALYNGSGEPTGPTMDTIFYIVEAVAPFAAGTDNIVQFNGWPMTNFAFPSYFFPFNNSGVYDLLQRSSAPFTPYKGSQFFLYQKSLSADGSVTTDMEAGALVSTPGAPNSIQFVLNGSIYSFENWGLKQEINVQTLASPDPSHMKGQKVNLKKSKKKQVKGQQTLTSFQGLSSGVHARRQHLDLDRAMRSCTRVSVKEVANQTSKTKTVSNKPHLLPFQFLDEDGVVTIRFKIINFIPYLLKPEDINPLSKTMVEFFNSRFYPYWNRKATIENYTAPCLPVFDGSFIPFYVVSSAMSNLNTPWGQSLLSGAADNLNNVPNALAGPLITEYLTGIPPLPLANPYLITNDVIYMDPSTQIAEYTAVVSHEMCELAIDPTYAFYYATSNPPEDHAILFSQWETSDPVEVPSVSQEGNGTTLAMNPFVLPSYFDAYLGNASYDQMGLAYRALVPGMPRQQIVWQAEGQPTQVAWVVNTLDGKGDLMLWNVGNIFIPATYLYSSFDMTPIPQTPLAPIYQRLQTPQPLY